MMYLSGETLAMIALTNEKFHIVKILLEHNKFDSDLVNNDGENLSWSYNRKTRLDTLLQ